MQNSSLVVDEKFSHLWQVMLYSLLGIAAITFVIFWNIENVLWAGIFRMISFIAFTGSIFCLLKVMEGKRNIHLTFENENLLIKYYKNERVIQEEVFQLDSIRSIKAVPAFISLPMKRYELPHRSAVTYKINFIDSDRELYLFEFGGGVLSVSTESHQRIKDFLAEHNIDIQSKLN